MSTVTIPKKEYQTLRRHSTAYRKIATRLFEAVVRDDIETVVKDFAATKLYSKAFIKDFEKGLRRSSWGKA